MPDSKTEMERLLEENLRLKVVAPSPSIGGRATVYVIAVVILCALALVFVLAVLIIRPEGDNTALFNAGLGVLVPAIGALLAASIQQVHLAVNSRLTQLIDLTTRASHAEGKAEGILLPSPLRKDR